ncbi:hypothetical protein ACKWTF_000706 [Chironomus riparius]
MKIIIIACFFVAVAAQELRPKPCGTNELYSNCGANGCQSTCANPTLNLVCKGTCIAGCICKEGYLRDSNGKCILAKDCPIICKGLEIFSDCAPNACKKTCDTLNTACRAPCVPGCKCPNNFVYSDKTKTKCIPIKACPQNSKIIFLFKIIILILFSNFFIFSFRMQKV